jgi:hypothetical protein
MTESITAQIAELHRMSVHQLRDRLQELTGTPCRQTHRRYLIKRVAFKIQEQHYGGLSDEAERQLTELRKKFEGTSPETWFNNRIKKAPQTAAQPKRRTRDPRLPSVGTILKRDYQGTGYSVEIAQDGFIFEGQPFKSLSAVAQSICGSHVNGFAFFRLNQGSKS